MRHFAIFRMIIIVSGDTPTRYIFIAAPERKECDLISMGPKPNRPLPSIWTAARNFVRIPAEVIVNLFPFVSMKVLTGSFVCVPVPLHDRTRVMIFLHSRTGQKSW